MNLSEAVLIDTGPLVALIDKADSSHQKCASIFRLLKKPPITTWPCLTEAFYLIGELRGWDGQNKLLEIITRGSIHIYTAQEDQIARIRELMQQYQDAPMDFADGSLVVLAEATGIRKIITLDSDFYLYRINGKDNFEVVTLDG